MTQRFNDLSRYAIGFNLLFDDLNRSFLHSGANSSYPPHSIKAISDTEFYLELAVAGFKKGEVTMEEHQGLLTITGDKSADTSDAAYQFRGIANRSFSKNFRIAEYFEVNDATLEDGILTVKFVKNMPEEAKPKLIAIK